MDTQPVQHLGLDETHPKTWRNGVTCKQCTAAVERRNPRGKAPSINIARLKADNAGGYTQRELGKEITDAARAKGMEIERAR